MRSKFKKIIFSPWFSIIIIVIAALIIYSNTYNSPFVFDDNHTITDNPQIKDLSNFSSPKQFLKPRSFVLFTFALNYQFNELNVFGYHLINILIHIANGILVYFLARLILILSLRPPGQNLHGIKTSGRKGNKAPDGSSYRVLQSELSNMSHVNAASAGLDMRVSFIALFAALIFIVHPIQTQAVTYIVQRYTSTVTFFYVASALSYIEARIFMRNRLATGINRSGICFQSFGFFALSFVCGFIASKSKENAASLPGVILLVEYICFGGTWKEWLKKLFWILPFVVIFEGLFLYSMNFHGGEGGINNLQDISMALRDTEEVSRWSYLCTQFNVLVIYLRLLVLPVRQNLDHMYPFKTVFFDGLTPLAFVCLVGLVAFAIWKRKKYPIVIFAVSWFFITLSVESTIIPIRDALVEHRLYLPMTGFSVLVAWLICHVFRKYKFVIILICIGIIVSLGTATYFRNQVWQDRVNLWNDVVKKSPHNASAYMNLGNALASEGRLNDAMAYYKKVVSAHPNNKKINYNIALLMEKDGDIEKSIYFYKNALAIDPDYVQAHVGLARMLRKRGDKDAAIKHYTRALNINPYLGDSYYVDLGNLYLERGDRIYALDYYKKALKINNDNAEAHSNIGVIFSLKGDYKKAVEHLKTALRLDALNPSILNNLGGVNEMKGDFAQAAIHYREALRIAPGFTKARHNLSRVLKKQKGQDDN